MTSKISPDVEQLADRLHSMAIHLLRRLRREDAASELNGPRLSALSVIVFGGPVTLGDLARAEQVRPPTMSRIVDALVQLGLATRKADPQDGRRTLIGATLSGRKLLVAGRERRVRALAERIAALEPNDQKQLQEALVILDRAISGM